MGRFCPVMNVEYGFHVCWKPHPNHPVNSMIADKKEKHSGLATLFDGVELKSFFINYLWFIIAVEILIFLVSFLGNLGPDKGPFPWKFYFYVSFIAPVAITFLLGVFILAFNQFIFGNSPAAGEDGSVGADGDDNRSKLFQFNLFLTHMKKVPFLPLLFVLVGLFRYARFRRSVGIAIQQRGVRRRALRLELVAVASLLGRHRLANQPRGAVGGLGVAVDEGVAQFMGDREPLAWPGSLRRRGSRSPAPAEARELPRRSDLPA